MTFRPALIACLLPALAGLSGCGALPWVQETRGVDSTSAFQLTDRDVVEPIDLGWLLARYAPAGAAGDVCEGQADQVPKFARVSPSAGCNGAEDAQAPDGTCAAKARMDRAFQFFACRIRQASAQDQVLARNSLQERLLLSSRQRCNAFQSNLQRDFSRVNFGLGSATTAAGALGALVSAPVAAGNYAAAAGIFSGMRAEYNQDYMANLAAHVIVDGIDRRLASSYDQIQKLGQTKAYADYPVEAAIKDALYYHGQCSVVAGFQQASDAIRYLNDPGLNGALQTIARVRDVAKAMSTPDLAPGELLSITERVTTSVPITAGSALASDKAAPEQLKLSAVRQAMLRIDRSAERTAQQLKTLTAKLKSGQKPTAADLGLDQSFDADPLGSTKLRSTCLEKSDSLLSLVVLSRAQSQDAPTAQANAEALGRAATALSLFGSISNRLDALANDYTARSGETQERRARLFNLAVLPDAQAATRSELKAIKPPTLDTTLADAVMSLCKAP